MTDFEYASNEMAADNKGDDSSCHVETSTEDDPRSYRKACHSRVLCWVPGTAQILRRRNRAQAIIIDADAASPIVMLSRLRPVMFVGNYLEFSWAHCEGR